MTSMDFVGTSENTGESIPLSALEHVAYCDRQAALIHVESAWTDSIDTVRGDLAHRAVDLAGTQRRHDLTAIRGLPVHSRQHGLHGVCDLVEITGSTAVPVEYKVGPYHPGGPADLQVAGQALCLSEIGYQTPVGYVYSATDRKRHEIPITAELIARTLAAARQIRGLMHEDRLPAARNDRRCRRCSLRDDCLPEIVGTLRRPDDLFMPHPPGSWRD